MKKNHTPTSRQHKGARAGTRPPMSTATRREVKGALGVIWLQYSIVEDLTDAIDGLLHPKKSLADELARAQETLSDYREVLASTEALGSRLEKVRRAAGIDDTVSMAGSLVDGITMMCKSGPIQRAAKARASLGPTEVLT